MLNTLLVLGCIFLLLVKFVNGKLGPDQDVENEPADKSDNQETEIPVAAEPVPNPEPAANAQPEPTQRTSVPQREYARLFGLIGKPLGHSTSMVRFNNMFRKEHIDAHYDNYELDNLDSFKSLVESHPNLRGLNVTIPYKKDVIPLLDGLDETAQAIGAVNTIKVCHTENGTRLIGYNTDWIGFTESYKHMLNGHHKALILGTGGVSKAVEYALEQLGISTRFVSRNSTFDIMGYYELSPSVMEEYDVIVNCTPLGMWPQTDDCPDIPYMFISEKHVLIDVIANPDETTFLRKGREHGAATKGGKDMLEQQAVAAWNIWNEK